MSFTLCFYRFGARHFPSSSLLLTYTRMADRTSARRLSRLGVHLLSTNVGLNQVRLARLSGQASENSVTSDPRKVKFTGSAYLSNKGQDVVEEEDWYQPNETWTQQSIDLYNQLKHEADQSNGKWVKIKGKPQTGEMRLFTRCLSERGKMFEYALFINKTDAEVHGVVQFGPFCEGHKGYVHGGAMATLLDTASAVHCNTSIGLCVTANFNVTFKAALPLSCTVLLQGKVDHVAGRKIHVFAEMKSSDGEILYATYTAMFIEVASKL